MTTTFEIVGTVRGAYWWPIGQEWEKPASYTFTRTHDTIRTSREAQTLREAVERLTDDGDSSSACHLTTDAVLIARRTGPTHTTERVFDLARFESVADYMTD